MADTQTLFNNDWQPPDTRFVPVQFLAKAPVDKLTQDYMVFGGSETKRVTAATALAAIEASGIAEPSRVVRVGVDSRYLFEAGAVEDVSAEVVAEDAENTVDPLTEASNQEPEATQEPAVNPEETEATAN